jgi:hypothetical protein
VRNRSFHSFGLAGSEQLRKSIETFQPLVTQSVARFPRHFCHCRLIAPLSASVLSQSYRYLPDICGMLEAVTVNQTEEPSARELARLAQKVLCQASQHAVETWPNEEEVLRLMQRLLEELLAFRRRARRR